MYNLQDLDTSDITILFGILLTNDKGLILDVILLANLSPIERKKSLNSLAIITLSDMQPLSVIKVTFRCLALQFLPIMSLSTFQHLLISDLFSSSSLLKYSISAFRRSDNNLFFVVVYLFFTSMLFKQLFIVLCNYSMSFTAFPFLIARSISCLRIINITLEFRISQHN